MENERKTFMVEDGTLHWRNFAGIEKPPFNPAGIRTFCVDLDPAVVEDMIKDGWNVKFHKFRDDDETTRTRDELDLRLVRSSRSGLAMTRDVSLVL